jgi:TPR repeat protein
MWLSKAAALGHAKSINIVGGFYEDGWEVDVDMDKALDHYIRAAEGGDFRGQFNAARLLADRGRMDDAVRWLRRVPDTATVAFLEKTRDFLLQSPHPEFQALSGWFESRMMRVAANASGGGNVGGLSDAGRINNADRIGNAAHDSDAADSDFPAGTAANPPSRASDA